MIDIDCTQCREGASCCQQGVWVDLAEASRIVSLGFAGEFYHLTRDKEFPSGYKLATSYNDAPCSFLTADNLCVIHKVDYNLKPTYCKEFPYEDGKIASDAEELCALFKKNLSLQLSKKRV